MTDDQLLINNLHDYIEQIEETITDEVEEQVSQTHQPPCPECFTKGFIEANKTRLMSEIYSITKQNPELGVSLLHRELILLTTAAHLVQGLMKMTIEMNDLDVEELIKPTHHNND